MKSDRRVPVAIVGGGFSGTMVAANLARSGIEAVLIEGGGRTGRGVAYSTVEPAHVLNVRAESMSAWAHDPQHFAAFFEAAGGDRRGFAQRRLFGRYLRLILEEATAAGCVRLIEDEAVAAEPGEDGWTIRLRSGDPVSASALVLALGNQPPEPLPFAPGDSRRLINNPWSGEAAAAVAELAESGGDALIIGTGLTMVDTVLSLDSAGHEGRMIAVSRRGLIPRGHAEFEPAPIGADELPGGSVRGLWRWLRRRSAEVGWRAAVDCLRPHSQALWQGLPPDERRRFLRHARPWWDVHRHRIAPDVAERLKQLVGEGRLEVVAGRILELAPAADGLDVRIARRGGQRELRARVEYAFNCTGPLGTISRTRDPLLRQMLEQALLCPDTRGIGIDVDEASRVTGAKRLWALGPLTKGRFWEIVAVPDIRVQAAQVAEDIARELGQ
jgi:uncharacterized NAD(P)/FAD-binding protein YdhS